MRPLDIFVIVTYVLALVGIGVYFSRKQRTTEEYFIAGQSIPGWAMGLSLLATIITSVTFIAYPGSSYAGDWSLLVPGIMFVALLALIGFVIVPFFRHVIHMSAYEYFGLRFGNLVRLYSSFAFAIGHFSKMGFVFYLVSLTLSGMTGIQVDRIILATAIITIFYTLLGGVEAVVWSDVVQGFVLWAGIIVCICYLLFLPPQGPHAVFMDAWTHGKMSLGSTAFRFDKPTIIVLIIYGLFFYLQKYTADQSVVQRYLLAKSDRSALRGIALGAFLCLPVWTSFMLIGSLLWSFYRLTGEAIPSTLTKSDQVFPHFLLTHIPAGLGGLFIAALMGSAMAMLASDMNCLAVIGTEDFYGLMYPKSTDRQRLRMGKIIVAVTGLAAAAIASKLAHSQGSALSLYYTISAVVAGGLAGLFLLAFLIRKATRKGAIAGIVANLIFTTWATLTEGGKIVDLGRYNFPYHDYIIGAIGHIVLFGIGLAVSLLLPGKVAGEDLTVWSWRQKQEQENR
ncbi:MAG TPA: sodium:solute symporter [Granulicella sp.]